MARRKKPSNYWKFKSAVLVFSWLLAWTPPLANSAPTYISPVLYQPSIFATDKIKITGVDSKPDEEGKVNAVGTLWHATAN